MLNYRVVFLFLVPVIACHKGNTETEEKAIAANAPSSAFYVRTSPVVQTQLGDIVYVTGIIQSDTEARPSFKTGGVIANTYVREGDAVKKGQLLARLNMTEIDAQANQAQVALDKAMRDQQRAQHLYADSVATLEQLQNATTAVDIAKKSLQIALFNVAYSEIRSPVEGKVVTQMLQEGEITGPGVPVYYIMGVKPSDWKLIAGLTDKNWGRIAAGNKVIVTLDAYPGWRMEAMVKRLADVANPQSGTFDVEITLPSKDNRLAAGMLAHAEIMPTVGSVYSVIPIEALVSSNGRSGVVYVPSKGRAEKRVVQIQRFEGERVAILSGLENITDVITAGSGFLEDGDEIIIESEK